MRYFYDCEFLEDGSTIDLISIGIVAEDGRQFYAVNSEAPWSRIAAHPWLMANVVPWLPQEPTDTPQRRGRRRRLCDLDHPCVSTRSEIADSVKSFLWAGGGPIELWAYYAAYDHVLLSQLWGTMIQRPAGIPMFTNDIQQVAYEMGLENSLPQQTSTQHNALDDAIWNREAYDYLMMMKGQGGDGGSGS